MKDALQRAYHTLPLLLLGWLLCVGAFTGALAQDRRITGRITDGSDNNALPGANVVVKGTQTGVVTDADGRFTLNVPAGRNVLTVSAIGFTGQEITIGNQTEVNVTMAGDVKTLNEVVVTGYGAQAKRDITGAVATVDVKEALKVPVTNVSQALQGRVAGVQVGNDNSPGGGVMVRIRGFGTLNDNSPLYIIDGVPTKGTNNTLNPNDIESIQVLKDASAASIYGSRAGNGVVIVTTKKGKAGKPKFTYDTYYGTQRPGRFLSLLNTQQYAELLWKSRINATNTLVNGVATPNAGQTSLVYPRNAQFGSGATPVIPDYIFPDGAKEGDPRLAQNPDGSYVNYSNDIDAADFRRTKFLITRANKEGTNWMDEIFDPAPIQNHQLGVAGGTEGGRYAMSLNYFNQQGILKYTGYKRYSVRANTEFNVSKRIRVGENLQIAYGERVGGGRSTQSVTANNNESNAISMAFRIQPIIPVYDVAGNFAGTKGGDLDNARNPVALLYRNKDNVGKDMRVFGNAYAEVDLIKNLTARTSFGLDYNQFNIRAYTPRDIESAESAGANSMYARNEYGYTWTWYNTLTYNGTFGSDIRYNVIVGTESIKNYFEFLQADRSRFADDGLENRYLDAGNAGTSTNTNGASNWRLASEFAKLNLVFFDKYLIDGTLRRDRSSRFSAANRVAYFPAVSAGWRISKEGFMAGTAGWLDDLKLRGAYGQTGNQEIGNYNPFLIYATNPATSFYDLNGSRTSSIQGYQLEQFGNANAKWETTSSIDFGLDASLFKGKIDLTFDWFSRKTTDALFPVEVQFTQGVAVNPFQNIAAFSNKGIELGLNYNGRALGGNLTYSVGANVSTYRNLVTRTDGNASTQYFGFGTRLPAMTVTQAGYPISSFFGYIIDGIYQTDEAAAAGPVQFGGGQNNKAGAFIFRDVNGDKIINASDRTIIGNPHPDFSYGLNINVGYKDINLTLFGQGVQGNQIFNYVRYWTDFPTFGGNRSTRMYYESWEPGKTDAKLPILRSNDNVSSNPSTYYLEDGSYLRLKNVQLGYNLPRGLMSRLGLSAATVYVQGQNLLTATRYTGLDPEINLRDSGATGNDRHIGVDEAAYPTAKSFLVGLNLAF